VVRGQRRGVVRVLEIERIERVRRNVAGERAAQEDPGDDDQARDCQAVAQEAAPRIRPLAARLDLETVLVDLLGGGRRDDPAGAGGGRNGSRAGLGLRNSESSDPDSRR
jgi:hypothetical protein